MSKTKMRFIFLVQGEGRGHMSQALALDKILTQNGDEVVYTFIGKSSRRKIPDYFLRQISSQVEQIDSPNFRLDSKNKSLKLISSILYNTKFLKTYYHSLQNIDQAVKKYQPDGIINFYDFLGGFYFQLFRPGIRHVVVGHHFMAAHPKFPFASGRSLEKWLFKANNTLTSMCAVQRIALSFRPLTPKIIDKTVIAPPLLRDKFTKCITTKEPFILAYIVNDGYAEELMEWHHKHPHTVIHCFWDRKGYDRKYNAHKNFILHPIDEDNFLDHLARCSGYVTTAGFESVAEALYMGKPVLVVPVKGQYEQACNALDAEYFEQVISSEKFELSALISLINNTKMKNDIFKIWADQSKEIMLHELHKR